jgi:hypothetical protein
MVDVMLSYDTFPAPSYLPYLLLGYYSVYPSLQQAYPNYSDVFKSPYDTVLPSLYYSKLYTTSQIDQFCHPVPRMMIQDSAIHAFETDTNHIFRRLLAENDLLGWVPQNPVKIYYCTGDRQVTYLNAIRADSVWNANGAPDVSSQGFGNLDHGPCVEPSLLAASLYLLGKISVCSGINESHVISFQLYPNPTSGTINIVKQEGILQFSVYDFHGRLAYSNRLTSVSEQIDLGQLPAGVYVVVLQDMKGNNARQKLFIR